MKKTLLLIIIVFSTIHSSNAKDIFYSIHQKSLHQKMPQQDPPTKTTLIVTSSPNLDEIEALQKYVKEVMPLLLDIGGTVIKRSKIEDVYHGEQKFVFLLVMDFPSKENVINLLNSKAYQNLIPNRDKGFSEINILFADDLP
ncbi:DUF1330 domain-containing protein [Aquimarina algiphila]|uniref:DUF1330 domain-containing protein n=1 Tax=Aquimarina algiphila TaxID=2047982 RepID=UPI00248FB2E4|nr:DUF1330 domain-containing protein [Aquimarina algiphila]